MLKSLVKQCYDVQGAQPIIREVVRNCDSCSDHIIHRHFIGHLFHHTRLTRDRICNDMSLVIKERPLLENNYFKNTPSLHPTAFILETVDTIDPNFNCMYTALSTI